MTKNQRIRMLEMELARLLGLIEAKEGHEPALDSVYELLFTRDAGKSND